MVADDNQQPEAQAQPQPRVIPNAIKVNNNNDLVDLLAVLLFTGLNEVKKQLLGERCLSLYDAKTSPYTQEIANMFDIDIQGESEEVVQALLQYPIFSKSYLGTQLGARKVLNPIMSNMEFKTHDNVDGMEPFRFIVRTDNTIGLDQKKAASLINRFSSLRDNAAEIILIDIICDKPFTIVEKVFIKHKRTYNIDKEVCHA